MRYCSPLRYPGGKAGLTGFLSDVIELNDLRGCSYYEPYAGGAGAALGLLKRGVVKEVHLNDADPRVYAFWRSSLHESNRFVDRLQSVSLTIDEWRRQRLISTNPLAHSLFDVGFATFFMNRCNRSGVISGAGPIGGYRQTGKWRLDVRFNRTTLAERVLKLSQLKDYVHVSCEDAIDFLKKALPRGQGRAEVFVYLDPPYVNNGPRLYLNAYRPEDHAQLARYLDAQTALPWIVSYDNSALVKKLYDRHNIALMQIRYTLQEKRAARELIISPQYVAIPREWRMNNCERPLW